MDGTTPPPTDLNQALLMLMQSAAPTLNAPYDEATTRAYMLSLADALHTAAAPSTPAATRIDDLAATLIADYDQRRAAAAAHGGVVGVRSGLGHLDETLNGLEPGKLYLLAAAPGTGKTTLSLKIAATVALAGDIAVYVSLENDAMDLARKTACRLGDVSYASALKGKTPLDEWQRAVRHLQRLGGRLYVSAPRASMPDIDGLLDSVTAQAGRRPALLVLDYLQAFAKRDRGANQVEIRERMDRLTPRLREIGERCGCAVLAISSQNRAGYAAGGMAAMKESGDLEYGGDVTMTLCRPEKAASVGPGRVALELRVEKNRSGLTGSGIPLALRGDRCMIEEVEL